jgi:hypothetical protein
MQATTHEKKKKADREKKAADRAELARLRRLLRGDDGVSKPYLTLELRAHDPQTGVDLVLPVGTSAEDAWKALFDFSWSPKQKS